MRGAGTISWICEAHFNHRLPRVCDPLRQSRSPGVPGEARSQSPPWFAGCSPHTYFFVRMILFARLKPCRGHTGLAFPRSASWDSTDGYCKDGGADAAGAGHAFRCRERLQCVACQEPAAYRGGRGAVHLGGLQQLPSGRPLAVAHRGRPAALDCAGAACRLLERPRLERSIQPRGLHRATARAGRCRPCLDDLHPGSVRLRTRTAPLGGPDRFLACDRSTECPPGAGGDHPGCHRGWRTAHSPANARTLHATPLAAAPSRRSHGSR